MLMLSKRYESTEVDRRKWKHVPSSSPAVPLTKYLKYKKRLLLSYIHYLKTGLIYSMDHMLFSGTEPSSVILSQTK